MIDKMNVASEMSNYIKWDAKRHQNSWSWTVSKKQKADLKWCNGYGKITESTVKKNKEPITFLSSDFHKVI